MLRGLAYTMMQRRLRDLPRDDVLAEIRPALKHASRQVTPEDFLTDVGSNGLLVERESGQYYFAHHTFQEYLAAAYIRDKGLAGDLAKNVDDAWWRETTLLYAALADANLIVRACLSSASVGAVTLAFDCADQGSVLAPDMLGTLEDLINGATAPSADPERRRLFAGVLLARHLRQQIRVGDGAHVCTRPITTALYQLFLEDGQHPPQDGPTPGKPGDEAASGMRASDAAAFVGWVNGIIGGGRVYRLPSRAEVDERIIQRRVSAPPPAASNRSTWLASDHALPELWVPPGAPHPYLIDAETLAAHVEYDFTGAVPTLTRLLLLRSVVRIRALARDLDRARRLFRSSDVASVLARKGALHDISNAPARDISRALNLSLSSDPIGGTARVLTRVLTRALAPDDDLTFANELDPDGARASYLGRAHTRALDLASALDLALRRDLARTDALAHALSLDRERGTGKALSHALSQALPGITGHNWPAVFSHAFINTAGVTGNSFVTSPDTLPGKLSTAAQALKAMAIGTPSGKTQRSAWTVEVAGRLQRTAAAVFDRREQLTPAAATSIRLAALCLGVEADELGQHMLGRTFREIAAGVTLLERRARGQAPATETILLATD